LHPGVYAGFLISGGQHGAPSIKRNSLRNILMTFFGHHGLMCYFRGHWMYQ